MFAAHAFTVQAPLLYNDPSSHRGSTTNPRKIRRRPAAFHAPNKRSTTRNQTQVTGLCLFSARLLTDVMEYVEDSAARSGAGGSPKASKRAADADDDDDDADAEEAADVVVAWPSPPGAARNADDAAAAAADGPGVIAATATYERVVEASAIERRRRGASH